ncbi:hypothetical protein GY45DRAFT_1431300 [Cubamyces sp. BRFM 1775]|nr:hypothetical protein GY45DRAFT_1431300 [Cubamyces sp. BRFM 1775]
MSTDPEAPTSASLICYNADNARSRALELTSALEGRLRTLLSEDSNGLRKEAFQESLSGLKSRALTPKTTIIVCGATGAGKSSLINALLGYDIVPTSCMRACTSLITEISYHNQDEYKAEIEFLTKDEWAVEVRLLLQDLEDSGGEELADEVEAARCKVQAVYPTLSLSSVSSSMTVEHVIAHESAVSPWLDKTVDVVKSDRSDFQTDLARYIESQDGPSDEATESMSPAYWPLIRQIRIWTKSDLLRCGAILVDLPGLGDSNPARNRVTQAFIAKADRFFIVAPITRAVDDKVARDLCGDVFKSQLQMNGKYHQDAITFIATKCDDVSCKEVVKGLKLAREPHYQQIESRLQASKHQLTVHEERKRSLEKLKRGLQGHLTLIDAPTPQVPLHASQIEQQLEGRAETLVENIVGKLSLSPTRSQSVVGHEHSSLKRDRESLSDTDDPPATKLQKLSDSTKAAIRAGPAATQQQLGSESASDDYSQLVELQRELDQVISAIQAASDRGEQAERDKLLYCTLRRSEWSKARLRAQFRTALDEIEDANADPDAMADSTRIRSDLPVFTVAARAFMDIQENADSDRLTSPFTESDTGIPALREWIQMVTLAAREEAAAKALVHLRDFARTVRGWVEGIPGVTLADREWLQARWRCEPSDTPEDDDESDEDDEDEDEEQQQDIRQVQLERYSQTPHAVVPSLLTAFHPIVGNIANDLSKRFEEELRDKWRNSAEEASSELVKASQDFVYKKRVAWSTYNATLRRNGVFTHDLNAILALPLTKRIAHAWTNVFKAKSLKGLKSEAATEIKTVLDAVVATMPKYLRPRAKELAAETLQTARYRLQDVQESVQVALEKKQREVSGALSPSIQEQLMDGYKEACDAVRGRGVFARQKKIFNDYLESKKATLFTDTADTVEEYLEEAAQAAGEALYIALEKIAKEVEVEISILWEGCPVKDDDDVKAGLAISDFLSEITEEVDRWLAAKDVSDKVARRPQP